MTMAQRVGTLGALTVAALLLPGCLLIRTTEHRIKLTEKGTGEAVIRLIDLRSDAVNDSVLNRDYSVMISSVQKEGITEFERGGRKVTSTRFIAGGDTLTAEILYTFPNLDQVEGLKMNKEELFVVVKEGRDIVRTNGSVESWVRKSRRIVWPRDAKFLTYVITEKKMPAATRSLAPLYQKFGYNLPEGAQ